MKISELPVPFWFLNLESFLKRAKIKHMKAGPGPQAQRTAAGSGWDSGLAAAWQPQSQTDINHVSKALWVRTPGAEGHVVQSTEQDAEL